MIQITRTHEICMGHRVYGHESKCSNMHGHNYIFEFTVRPKTSLDRVGRVVDFSEVKSVLCVWLEKNWDHKFLIFDKDPLYQELDFILTNGSDYVSGFISVPFNPTAENIAEHFLNFSHYLTIDKDWYLYSITLHETSKCSAYVCLTPEKEKEIKELKQLVVMPRDCYCTLQCGSERNCICEGKSDIEKKNCNNCVLDLPF